MRQALIAVPLVVLTAGAAFWMGRLSITNAAPNANQQLTRTGTTLEDRTPLPAVARLGSEPTDVRPAHAEAVGEVSLAGPASAAPRSETVGPCGTSKGAGRAEAAGAGSARPAGRPGEVLAVVKRERASRVSHSVGPDGVSFEPVRRTTP